MDEYNQNFNSEENNVENDGNNTSSEPQNQSSEDDGAAESFDTQNQGNFNDTQNNYQNDNEPMWNKVNYTPVTPINDYKPMNKGLKIFCINFKHRKVAYRITCNIFCIVFRAVIHINFKFRSADFGIYMVISYNITVFSIYNA